MPERSESSKVPKTLHGCSTGRKDSNQLYAIFNVMQSKGEPVAPRSAALKRAYGQRFRLFRTETRPMILSSSRRQGDIT